MENPLYNPDEWARTKTVLATSAIVGVIVAIAGAVVKERHGGWLGLVRDLLASLLLSGMVGLYVAEQGVSQSILILVTGGAAFVGPDVLAAVGKFGGVLRDDLLGVAERIWKNIKPGGGR